MESNKPQNQQRMLLISLALWLLMILATRLQFRFSSDSLNSFWTIATLSMAVVVLYHSWRCPQRIFKKVLLFAAMMLMMLFLTIAINIFNIVEGLFNSGESVVQKLHVNSHDDVAVSEISTGLFNQGVVKVVVEQRRQVFPGIQRVYKLDEIRCSGGGYATVTGDDAVNYHLSTGDLKGHEVKLHK